MPESYGAGRRSYHSSLNVVAVGWRLMKISVHGNVLPYRILYRLLGHTVSMASLLVTRRAPMDK